MKNILIIDEEINSSIVMVSLKNYLIEEKYKLSFCEYVDDAVNIVKNEKFDAIILDIMMPHKALYKIEKTKGGLQTGTHFFYDLRKGNFGETNKNTFVIIYTNVDKEYLIYQLGSSVSYFAVVSKPYKQEVIDLLGRRHA